MPQPQRNGHANGIAPFDFVPEWEWVNYPALDVVGDDWIDDERYHGFAIEVLLSPSGNQVRAHDVATRQYVAKVRPNGELTNDEQLLEDAEAIYLDAIAYRIRAWNFRDDGVDVPAPGLVETGSDAFYRLPPALRIWCTRVITNSTRPKLMTRRSSNVGTTVGVTPPPSNLGATPPDS